MPDEKAQVPPPKSNPDDASAAELPEGPAAADPEEHPVAEPTAAEPLADKVRQLPSEPGVYVFKDARGKPLYVGKAKSLRDRVRSYLGSTADQDPKTRALMKRARDVDYMVTRNDVEALILECNLIKENRPRYNIRLRDDKKYPYIRVTTDVFPRVFVTRTIVHDGSEYFGPYSDVGAMRRTLALLQRVFQTRPCTPESLEGIDRPCLYYDIKMCQAPCVGLQTREDYLETVEHVRLFLGGRTAELVSRLKTGMQALSEAMEFEQAARLRDQIHAIERMTDRMRTLVTDDLERDALALRRDGNDFCGVVLKIRGGKLLASETFYFSDADAEESATFTAFVEQYYAQTTSVPQEVLLGGMVSDVPLLEDWLSYKRGSNVRVVRPQRGEKQTLVGLALKNASIKLDEWAIAHGRTQKRVPEEIVQLREVLGTANLPRRIECFDISNFQGAHPVASLVHFEGGEPRKNRYRHFRIRGVQGPNDFAMMEHVVERHFRRLQEASEELPELVMVDGGKGQLSAARRALDRLGLGSAVDLIGLAKRNEEIFRSGYEQPVVLPRTSPALKLVQRVRNEAHRFAITYHRHLRSERLVRSALDDIPGVGQKTRLALLRHFGSVDAIGRASAEQLASVPGIGAATAERILSVLAHPALRSGATNAEDTPDTSTAATSAQAACDSNEQLEAMPAPAAGEAAATAGAQDTETEANGLPVVEADDVEAEEVDLDPQSATLPEANPDA